MKIKDNGFRKYIRNKNREFVKRTKQSLDITTVVLRKHIVYNPIPNLPLKIALSLGNYFSFTLFVQKKASGTTKLV